jgi:integrase
MPRTLHRLTALAVSSKKKPGYHCDGGGLYLRVTQSRTKGWVFRFTLNGKTRDAGLGRYPDVSLADARKMAEDFRRQVATGLDPIDQRDKARAAARRAEARKSTFEACCRAYILSHEPGWSNDKHRRQWSSTLEQYVYPLVGSLSVSEIDTDAVMQVLAPIRADKPETASRVRGRMERILSWAKVRGLRDGENPAQWRGQLDQLLPAKNKIHKVVHHSAIPFADAPGFLAALRTHQRGAARALEFLILTAARTGEALGAQWSEINFDQRLWTIPEERMKGRKAHRVPLSDPALSILEEMLAIRLNDFVFPGAKPGRPLSTMAMAMLMRRMGFGQFTPHGFRSTFRDWAAEHTNFPAPVAEMALAHSVRNRVEAAYRRGDLLDKRRQLMMAWADALSQDPIKKAPQQRWSLAVV